MKWKTYKCSHCGKTFKNPINQVWIKSFCQKMNRIVHVYKTK